MSANDYAAILGSVAALIIAIGGLAVWREKKEPTPPARPDDRAQRIESTLQRIESTLQRIESKIDILTDRIPR